MTRATIYNSYIAVRPSIRCAFSEIVQEMRKTSSHVWTVIGNFLNKVASIIIKTISECKPSTLLFLVAYNVPVQSPCANGIWITNISVVSLCANYATSIAFQASITAIFRRRHLIRKTTKIIRMPTFFISTLKRS